MDWRLSIMWSQLRAIGNSTLARSAIAVPVVGYFLLFNADIVRWLTLHTDFCAASGCNVSWRLYCLYFGGCAFAVGAIIYGLGCPREVRKYEDAEDFMSHEGRLEPD